MNRLIAIYIFLIVYVFAMLRPILPLVEYYVNYDYIAEQLCENRNKPILGCNGKCYVAKEIQKTLPDTPVENNSKIPKIDFNKYPVIPLEKFVYHVIKDSYLFKKSWLYKEDCMQEYIPSLLRPPQV